MIDRAVFEKYLENLGTSDPKYWPVARYELVQTGKEIIDLLIKELKNKEPIIRGRIAKILGEIGEKKAASPLIEALKSETDSYVCSSIVNALGKLQDIEALNILLLKLKAKEPKVRKEAARALGDIQSSEALEPLKEYYEKSNGEEKIWATYGLVKLGEKRFIHLLEDYLKEEVQIAAIKVAGRLKLKENKAILLELLHVSNNTDLRIEIIKALAEMGDKKVLNVLNGYYEKCSGEERIWVIYAISRLGDKSKESIITDILKKEVRKAATIALGEIGDRNSVNVLLDSIKSNEKDLRYAAALALKNVGDENILEKLNEAMEKETENHIKLAIEDIIS